MRLDFTISVLNPSDIRSTIGKVEFPDWLDSISTAPLEYRGEELFLIVVEDEFGNPWDELRGSDDARQQEVLIWLAGLLIWPKWVARTGLHQCLCARRGDRLSLSDEYSSYHRGGRNL